MRFVELLFTAAVFAAPALADGVAPPSFRDLAGQWHCEGVFVSNGKVISSNIDVTWDEITGTLIVHHDDVAPFQYHVVELWTAGKTGLQARLADSTGGVRDFTAPGWVNKTLTWQGVATTPYDERFVYTLVGPATLRADWQVSKDGASYRTGDTLTCKKS